MGNGTIKPGRRTKIWTKAEKPPLYKVILLNDDYTPREFVIGVLKKVFGMSEGPAHRVMLTAHTRGTCLVLVYTRDVAETKVQHGLEEGRKAGYPLMFTTEPEQKVRTLPAGVQGSRPDERDQEGVAMSAVIRINPFEVPSGTGRGSPAASGKERPNPTHTNPAGKCQRPDTAYCQRLNRRALTLWMRAEIQKQCRHSQCQQGLAPQDKPLTAGIRFMPQ